MVKKRITRKQLLKKPDEFISFSSRLLQFMIKYKVQISFAVGVIALFVIVVSGILYFSNKAENRAFALLNQAVIGYNFILKDNGPEKAYQDIGQDFNFIIKKYSRRDAAKLAGLIYANICYNAGDYEKATALYDKSLKDFKNHPSIKTFILSATGYNHEEKNDYKAAVNSFETIVSQSGAIMKDEALFNLGRLYAAMGENEKSMAAFKKIISEHTDSIYVEFAREKVSG
ncbi:MAG: tetratricopeptide repeat protein [Thermodesulfobacteriota bacterium]|nr:tetratricopeptide repeat protein [Thermodesulfobacteriota bacterium]